jgi:hypothetical protein
MNKRGTIIRFSPMAGKRPMAKMAVVVSLTFVVVIVCFGYSPVRKLLTLERTLNARWADVDALCQRR